MIDFMNYIKKTRVLKENLVMRRICRNAMLNDGTDDVFKKSDGVHSFYDRNQSSFDFIFNAFNWQTTKEGLFYWRNVYNITLGGEIS